MKVYDCFTFYNEFELLELRLKSLWDIVDYFVIVEADKNHTNKPKPFYFAERKDEFKEFLPKIRNIQLNVDIDYKGVGDWSIENGQRNGILYGLSDAAPDDLIFISDADEIPAPDILKRINENKTPLITFCALAPPNGCVLKVPCQILIPASSLLEYSPITMEQTFHYYYFDWVAKSRWTGTVLTKRKNLINPQSARNAKDKFAFIPDGGWHFSYMGGVDKIINKMTSIVEGNEFVKHANKNLTDKERVKECMRTGKDIYGRKNIPESQFYPYDISKINLPYLDEFLKKYPYFLREYDFDKD
ncbi:MAG: hypothetical protein IJQ16_08430 [Selenomonadaceae bacterium]|nr:hypothetical protein [Selenomonadaceae bacterium]